MRMHKRIALLLTLALLVSLLPMAALPAAAAAPPEVSVSTWGELAGALQQDGASITLTGDVYSADSDVSLNVPANTAVTLDLNGYVIDAHRHDFDAILTVAGTLTLCDRAGAGVISGALKDGVNVNGIEVDGGKFTMNGGAISDCRFDGVYVHHNGEFTMNGGAIRGNEGEGVSVYSGGKFTMNGGVIRDSSYNGVYLLNGEFTMEDGEISGNVYYGVAVYSSGKFTMNGGVIRDNGLMTEDDCYDGVYVKGGAFAMAGGTISDNKDDGVEVNGGTFTMTGGVIRGSASAGVYVYNSGAFKMEDGEISGNTGDGVEVYSDGFFMMTGGAIRSNGVNGVQDDYYGGVYVDGGAFMMRGGTISGNDDDGVYVESGVFAMLDGTISGNPYGVYVNEGGELGIGGSPVFSGNETDFCLSGAAGEGSPVDDSPYIVVMDTLTTMGITVDVKGDIPDGGLPFAYPDGGAEITPFNFSSARAGYHVELRADGNAYLIQGDVTLSLTPETLSLTQGGAAALTYTVTPEAAVRFVSSDAAVARVDESGTVTAVAPGTAVITAIAEGGAKAVCTVTVTGPSPYIAGGGSKTYKITVAETANGSATASRNTAAEGEKITVTAAPAEGYVLESITVKGEKAGNVEVKDGAFTMPADDVTVTVKFRKADARQTFTDVQPGDWFYEGVEYVAAKGIMQGPGGGIFQPNETTTRAMVAQVIWNMAGKPVVNAVIPFADVAEGAWYANAVRWAAEKGIVTGWTDENGKQVFDPEGKVTREQFAAMLYRYAKTLGKGFTGLWSFKLDFPDAGDVSDWAAEAMSWMVMQGIVDGMDGKLNPKGFSTRAQIAAMLQRFDTLG